MAAHMRVAQTYSLILSILDLESGVVAVKVAEGEEVPKLAAPGTLAQVFTGSQGNTLCPILFP